MIKDNQVQELSGYIKGGLFRPLNGIETDDFIQWARTEYKPLTKISLAWHPVIQIECHEINSKTVKDLWRSVDHSQCRRMDMVQRRE